MFSQSLKRFKKVVSKEKGGILPIQRNTDKTILTVKKIELLLDGRECFAVDRELTGYETKNRRAGISLEDSPPEDWYHYLELKSVLRTCNGPSSYTVDLHYPPSILPPTHSPVGRTG